ncbi:MAG: hypothetical protein B6U94_06295 [Thermofilum sp. ex4484_79]|nr:MAG: hypothetical protein B6U94_06295 [Thermofilum sp. ex4484_79]
MMKKSLSPLDAFLLLECFEEYEGARIKKVYSVDDETILFRIRSYHGNNILLFNTKLGLFPIYTLEIKTVNPSPFVDRLRSDINSSIIEGISQVNGDRIYCMFLRRRDCLYRLYLEWIREGNIVLTDKDGIILYALRMREYKDRKVLQGEKYKPPPLKGCDPLLLDYYLSFDRKHGNKKVITVLARSLNTPLEVLLESLKRNNIDPNSKIVFLDENVVADIMDDIRKITKEALVHRQFYAIYSNGKITGIFPFLPTYIDAEVKRIDNVCSELEKYFQTIYEAIKTDKEDKQGRIYVILEVIRDFEEKSKKLRLVARTLENEYTKYNRLIEEYANLKKSGQNYDRILQKLKQIENNIEKIDFAKDIIFLKMHGTDFSLKASHSLYDNISSLYDQAKKYERKIVKAKQVLEEYNKERCKRLQEVQIIRHFPRKKWYENFRWFISSGGYLVVGGRDASQNETLVKKFLRENDLFFHAEIRGGSIVIVKTEGREIDENTIREAAVQAAVYSKAWELGLYSIDVYWVYGHQVSKTPPSGEYLTKGSFMVYGRKNYIKNVPLELALGYSIEFSQNFFWYKIIAGPRIPIESHSDLVFLLQPGRLERDLMTKKIIAQIADFTKKIVNKKISFDKLRENIIYHLPKGRYYLVKHYRVRR